MKSPMWRMIGILLPVVVVAVFISYQLHTRFSPETILSDWEGYEKALIYETFGKYCNGPNEVDACLSWAVGPDWRQVYLSEYDDRWRERHPDEPMIVGSTSIEEGTRIMVESWREHRDVVDKINTELSY